MSRHTAPLPIRVSGDAITDEITLTVITRPNIILAVLTGSESSSLTMVTHKTNFEGYSEYYFSFQTERGQYNRFINPVAIDIAERQVEDMPLECR